MLSALYFTDLHLWDRDISTRMDHSSEAVLAKLEYMVDLANHLGCQYLLSGGDLCQDKIDSDDYRARIIRTLKKSNAKFLTLIGNHDILWRSFDSFSHRTVGVLGAADLAEVFEGQLLDEGILGISAFRTLPSEVLERSSDVTTIFAHHYINHGPDRLVLEIPKLKIRFPNLSYVFTGHDHAEYPTVSIDGVSVFRPGGAMRCSTALENVRRQPMCLHLQFEGGELRSISSYPLPCLPAAQAFNLDVKAVVKSAETQFDQFVADLSSSKAVGLDLSEALQSKLMAVTDPELRSYLVEDIPLIGSEA